ncbi:MAG: glycoside hydrolase family 31 protein [Agromyces sp.]
MSKSLEILRLGGEVWWGGAVADGDDMPFESRFGRDLSTWLGDNQGAPVLVSSAGRYVWSEGALSFAFDGEHMRVKADEPLLHAGRGGGCLRDAFGAVSAMFFPASGAAPDARLFSAPQYNTWIELVYDQTQERVLEYGRGIVDNGFPPGVLMIDDNWQEDYGVWEFHPARFTDPTAMVDELHELGFAVMLWVCPFVSPDSATFRELEQVRLLLRNADGTTAIRRWWNGYSGVLDLTNPATVEWLHSRLEHLRTTYGIDGFKFDAGDPRFYRDDDISHTPATPNEHCESWARIGLNYPLNEYRACWKLAGQPLGQRQTDLDPSWGKLGLGSIISWGIAQGLAGYAFNCPDMIGGGLAEMFEQSAYEHDSERFVRWVQASALFPMMQFSLAPWRVLSTEELEYVRDAVNLRTKLTPTILELVEHAARTGEPILRNLEYVFPHQGLARITDQFMLGDTIMVAPVLTRGARQRFIRFPEGTWTGDDGSTVIGPCELQIEAPLGRLPMYMRLADRDR